jgi:hypothetical protein
MHRRAGAIGLAEPTDAIGEGVGFTDGRNVALGEPVGLYRGRAGVRGGDVPCAGWVAPA